jgi:RNA polymerase sigma-70 factor, ECF subfamily
MDTDKSGETNTLYSHREFEKFFKEKYSGLCRYARKYTGDLESAEEVVQDVFVKIWEKRDQLNIHGSVLSYIISAVRNNALNYIRHSNIVSAYEHGDHLHESVFSSSAEEEMTNMELEDAIIQAIARLPEQRKKIFQMSRSDGLKYYEIAEKMGISIKTVEAQMGKALKQLREFLKEYITVMFTPLILLLEKFF